MVSLFKYSSSISEMHIPLCRMYCDSKTNLIVVNDTILGNIMVRGGISILCNLVQYHIYSVKVT